MSQNYDCEFVFVNLESIKLFWTINKKRKKAK